MIDKRITYTVACFLLLSGLSYSCLAAITSGQDEPETARVYGPYHGLFIQGGLGLKKPFSPLDAPLAPGSPWSIYCWVRSDGLLPAHTLLAGFGDLNAVAGGQRFLAIVDGHPSFWSGSTSVTAPGTCTPVNWCFLAATFDGTTVRLYQDGAEAAASAVQLQPASALIQLAPQPLPWADGAHFSGKIAQFTLANRVLTVEEVRALLPQPIPLDVLPFEAGSKAWPVSTRATFGMRAPQDPATLPKSNAAISMPTAQVPYNGPALVARGADQWVLAGGWRLTEGPRVLAGAASISAPGFHTDGWLDATVPGTVLTTLIDRGLYPDPDYGLNNLAIPETLNKQDYWYRTEFLVPLSMKGRRLAITFEGINYAAEVWFDGNRLGDIQGAFIRGTFDITDVVNPGKLNALAVRVSPPPHPGIPHEQSVKAGAGLNGGMLCLDGPTFICTEGWDWLPAIRDRNTGIWQDVVLTATGTVRIGDVRVVTSLPLPSTNRADVQLTIPLFNDSTSAVSGLLEASFERVNITKKLQVRPGETQITLAPVDFPQLSLANPRLWWPNGYGNPELYHLKVSFSGARGQSDTRSLRFGIREISYELTLLDKAGQLRRVEYSPTAANGRRVVDVRYEAALESSAGYVYSLIPGAESSPSIHALDDLRASPYLVVRVNGVRIACKGGNWGLDDSRKRVSRERLEPYVRLHRDAHLTMIRNWCGQSTEEALYDLCDEYGLLVWNDFWITTQDSNLDPSDTALFLANARDTLLRFRNHPSVALWCGRNEGMPTPAINDGLDDLIRTLDGTRCYLPNSRLIDLAPSGPWNHGEPVEFFTTRARGFSTELGLPSPPTIEAFRAMMPECDLWPPNDTWAYHDWHSDGGGRVASFMASMEQQFGAPTSLEDFERKAQLMNYVDHRAMFEGFNAHLWAPNSGRLLWMSQPAWPSMSWQLFSHDYDTHGTYYGVKKACEPIHVQLNLPDLTIMIVNNTTAPLTALSLTAHVFSMDARLLWTRDTRLAAGPNMTTPGFPLDLPSEASSGVVFVKLELKDLERGLLSENFYWYADQPSASRRLAELPAVLVNGSANLNRSGDHVRVFVDLANDAHGVALMNHVTLRHVADGQRVLPAYFDDNYVSLLPGETRRIDIDCPASAVHGDLEVGLEGWNVSPIVIPCRQSQDISRKQPESRLARSSPAIPRGRIPR
ncbi:MAG: LamG-like jellyroll fold domain-containing protein [Acidobacteriota bacterium]|jgi:hypothetical protein